MATFRRVKRDRIPGCPGPSDRSRNGDVRSQSCDASNIDERTFAYYPPLRRVKEQLDRDLSQKMDLRLAAGIAGLEPKYFSAFFHAKTGVCFTDWLRYRRIESAKAEFCRWDCPVTRVAFAVGFQDLTTFERSFKKVTGKTPREFKSEVCPPVGR